MSQSWRYQIALATWNQKGNVIMAWLTKSSYQIQYTSIRKRVSANQWWHTQRASRNLSSLRHGEILSMSNVMSWSWSLVWNTWFKLSAVNCRALIRLFHACQCSLVYHNSKVNAKAWNKNCQDYSDYLLIFIYILHGLRRFLSIPEILELAPFLK